jgi:hypothetical protein
MGGLTLATEMCERSIDVRNFFRSVSLVMLTDLNECFSDGSRSG